ncbi:MAG: hypothetical protein ACPL1Z_04270 [Candidatus Bathyarchaeales archaeon]
MEKPQKLATIILIALLAAAFLIPLAKLQVPLIPMTIDGYVLIRRIDETNKTVPAGFAVYAKEGTTIINVEDPNRKWITDSNGYYMLGASASQDNMLIDLWVENINVTRIVFHQGTFLTLNLTVIDTTPPTIEIISPTPNETLPPNQPTWINATLTDNFALDAATITLTLNATELTPTYDSETGLLYCQTNPLTSGHYSIGLSVEDLAGNLATETWNFTVTEEVPPEPPTVAIISPTTTSPTYTQSDQTVQVTYQYTEINPKNATIKVYNSTHTVVTRTITDLVGGTNIQRTEILPIPAGTAEGSYNLNVTIFNIYDLSATATQTSALIVDNTNPTVTITYPVDGACLSTGKVWINGTITETNVGAQTPTINDARFTLQVWETATGKFAFLNNTALPDNQITVTVHFTDLAQNTASDTVSFTLDNTAPSISNPYQDPPGQVVQPGETVEVEVGYNITVKVNVTELNPEKVSLYYNISATEWREIQMNPTTGNQYTATIPSGSLEPCTTIYYYILAVDKAGNTAQTPVAGVYFETHIISEFTMLTIIVALLAFTVAIAAKGKNKTRP